MSERRDRVLVVDDEKLIRWSVGERLTRTGYEVDTAESGEEALVKVGEKAPDLMLLDVRLPGIDGLATLQRALVMRPGMVVVMMSAHGTVDIAVEAMKRGAADFLVKPFAFSLLDATVERALSVAGTRARIAEFTDARRGGKRAIDNIVGPSALMQQIRDMVVRLAASDATTVLIEGESGTGKGVVARALHFESARADKPFMEVNCAALPENLLESELFGHERGAFTDAHAQKHGLFETANGGTVFLDEIGDLHAGGQAKLLTLLESKSFRRVGGVTELRADVRVIAATNVDLQKRVADGRFRTDLYFRLNIVPIAIPALRERPEDVPMLAAHFIARCNREMKRQVQGISPAAMAALSAHSWPGNARELRNVIERAMILHPDVDELRPEHLSPDLQRGATPSAPQRPLAPPIDLTGSGHNELEETERRLIAQAMEKVHGNQSQAARLLGISRDTLRYRMKKYGVV